MAKNFLIHTTAKVHPDSTISNGDKILANAIVQSDVELGNNVIIGEGVFIGEQSSIGNNVNIKGNEPAGCFVRYEDESETGNPLPEETPCETSDEQHQQKVDVVPEQLSPTRLKGNVKIGEGTVIERNVVIHENVTIGENCHIHQGVEIGEKSIIDHNCIIQKNVSLHPDSVLNSHVLIEAESHFSIPINVLEGTRIGQNVSTQYQEKKLRIIDPEGLPIDKHKKKPVYIHKGVYIGNHVTLTENTTIGDWAMVADHAVVKDHIPPNALITDNHQLRGFICACESLLQPIDQDADAKDPVVLYCQTCGSQYDISRFNYQQINNPIAEKTPVQKVIRQSFKPEAPCIKVLNEIVKPLKQKNQQKSVP